MPIKKVVNGQFVEELSEHEFKRGLYRLACENTEEYNRLLREFKRALLDDVIKTTQNKKRGISKEKRVFKLLQAREGRRHRSKLNANMLERYGKKPEHTDDHHLVSWNHPEAVRARAILAKYGIDIDSAYNGVRLPSSSRFLPHPAMPKAPSHKKIHTNEYYLNLTDLLKEVNAVPNATKQDIIDALDEVATDLTNGIFPI